MPELRIRKSLLAPVILLAGSVAILVFAISETSAPESTERDLARARNALRSGRLQQALQEAENILERESDNSAALFVAAEAETKLGHFEKAVTYYDAVSEEKEKIRAQAYAAEVLRHIGDLFGAVQRFQWVVSQERSLSL